MPNRVVTESGAAFTTTVSGTAKPLNSTAANAGTVVAVVSKTAKVPPIYNASGGGGGSVPTSGQLFPRK